MRNSVIDNLYFKIACCCSYLFYKAVSADGTVKECRGLVPQAIIHAVLESQCQVLQAAAAPERGLHLGRRRCHDTPAKKKWCSAVINLHLFI